MDINAIKKKLEGLQNSQKVSPKEDNTQWKPSIGKQIVRVVPSKFNKAMPFSEIKFHYGIVKKVMVSPINFGEKDPLVEFAKKLRKSEEPENWKLAKKLEPKTRYFAPVIVRGEEDKGVRIWQFGKEIYETFLQLATDEEVGDYTDVMEGRDIKLTTVGPETTGTPYNRTTIAPSMKTSPLSEDADEIEVWLDNQVNPMELYYRFSYEEMKEFLTEYLNVEEEGGETENSETEDQGKSNYSKDTSNFTIKKTKEDEFDDLFKDSTDGEDEEDDLPWKD